jgi:hypothetical protein
MINAMTARYNCFMVAQNAVAVAIVVQRTWRVSGSMNT